FNNAQNLIKPGMFCHVTIVTQVTPHVVVVPREAIHNTPKGPNVIVVDDKLVAHQRAVKTGDQDVNGIAIIEGVQAGEKVVTLSAQPVRDGQTVKIDTGNGQTQVAGQPAVEGGGGGASVGNGGGGGGGANAPTYSIAPSSGGTVGGNGAA